MCLEEKRGRFTFSRRFLYFYEKKVWGSDSQRYMENQKINRKTRRETKKTPKTPTKSEASPNLLYSLR
ncbi:MAG: hypothetical protein U9P88_00370 [Patescibacteria group bacterium]|nr:hypothetical protein [Patescibacteria group bacterium]